MKKKIKILINDIIYRRFPDFHYNYKLNFEYDERLSNLLKTEKIVKINQNLRVNSDTENITTTEIYFSNGVIFKFWNENKYYAWLKSGIFTSFGSEVEFVESRPSSRTMLMFKNAIKNFEFVKQPEKNAITKIQWIFKTEEKRSLIKSIKNRFVIFLNKNF
jgi:hypothetical protein